MGCNTSSPPQVALPARDKTAEAVKGEVSEEEKKPIPEFMAAAPATPAALQTWYGGIKMSYLRRLELDVHFDCNWKIRDVVDKFIKERTYGASMVEALLGKKEGHELVNQVANHYISYSPKSTWMDVIDALAMVGDEEFVFFDIFCENQHNVGKNKSSSERLNEMENRLRKIRSVIFVLSPWNHPANVGYIFCNFEFYFVELIAKSAESTSLQIKIETCMPSRTVQEMRKALCKGHCRSTFFKGFFSPANVEKLPIADVELVQKIKSENIASEINEAVKLRLRDCFFKYALEQLEAGQATLTNLEKGNVYRSLGCLCFVRNDFTQGVEWREKAGRFE